MVTSHTTEIYAHALAYDRYNAEKVSRELEIVFVLMIMMTYCALRSVDLAVYFKIKITPSK